MARNLLGSVATGDTVLAVAVGGSVEVQSDVQRGSGYALRCASDGQSDSYCTWQGWAATGVWAVLNVTVEWYRFYFLYKIKSVTDPQTMAVILATDGTCKMTLVLTAAGTIRVCDKNGATLATGATVLTADRWYCIEVKCGTGIAAPWALQIDEVAEVSGTSSLIGTQNGSLVTGIYQTLISETVEFYYDAIAGDAAAWPGSGYVNRLDVDGAGHYTVAEGTYEDVDDIPHNGDGDYITADAESQNQESVSLEASAAAGISGTILTVLAVTVQRDLGSASALCKALLRSGTTDLWTTAVRPNTTYKPLAILRVTDPADSQPWTLSKLADIEVGCEVSTHGAPARCTMMCALVEFRPAAAPAAADLIGLLTSKRKENGMFPPEMIGQNVKVAAGHVDTGQTTATIAIVAAGGTGVKNRVYIEGVTLGAAGYVTVCSATTPLLPKIMFPAKAMLPVGVLVEGAANEAINLIPVLDAAPGADVPCECAYYADTH
jgi:hypothetical protein